MALTPEDVVTKEFGRPKSFGRSGYDEGQVDDFLDDIVVELRRLNAENEDLAAKLDDCRRTKGQGARPAGNETGRSPAAAVPPGLTPVPVGAGANGSGDVQAAQSRLATLKAEIARADDAARGAQEAQRQAEERLTAIHAELNKAQAAERESQERVARARAQAEHAERQAAAATSAVPATAPASPSAALAVGGMAPGGDAAGVIALAQRLHDEHVAEGQKTKSRLVGEGETYRDRVVGEANARRDELLRTAQTQHDSLIQTGQSKHDELVRTGQSKHDELVKAGQGRHDQLVGEATERATTLVRDAEGQRSTILSQLTNERDRLTGDIEGLRGFERDYRGKLKSFITGQLKQLDHTTIDVDGDPTRRDSGGPKSG